jgi:CRISPR-associated endoribonuclease Cas6
LQRDISFWVKRDRLHEQKEQKAFTLSPLQIAKRPTLDPILGWQHNQAIPAGTPCWWRISLLDDALFGHLSQLWLNLNPQHPWHLGSADLQITSLLGTPQSTQPWANFCTYTQLYEQASECDRQIEFSFCTPTAFRQSQHDSALPTRESERTLFQPT